MHEDVQTLGGDEEGDLQGAGLGGDVAVDAAGHAVVAGVLDGHAVVDKELLVGLIANEGRHADAGAHHLESAAQQLGRSLLVHAQGDGVVRQGRLLGSVQDQVGELVGGVLAGLGNHAADGGVVPLGHAGVLGAVGLAGDAVDLHDLHAEDLEQLENLLVGDQAGLDVVLVERVEQLVHAPERSGGAGAGHEEGHPVGLDGLAEGLGRVVRDLAADAGHLQQLGLALRVRALGRLGLGQVGVAAGPAAPGLKDADDALPVHLLLDGVDLGVAQVLEALLGLGDDALGALLEDAVVVDGDQVEARAQAHAGHGVTAAGAAGAALPRRKDDA